MTRFRYIFGVVFIFTAFLRISSLLSNPPSLFSDEVDAGYQAYIFNKCRTDTYGNKLPVHFQSSADQKSPLNIYGIALLRSITNNPELSVRLPSAIFGILVTLFFFLILKEYVGKWMALVGFTVFSLNPWLFHYSRAGWEVVGMLFVLMAGIYFWIKYLNSKKLLYLQASLLSFVLSFYFYSTAKLFVIFIGAIVLGVWIKEIVKIKRNHWLLGVGLVLLASLPMLVDTFNGKSGYRFSYINIFSDPTTPSEVDFARFEDATVELNGQESLGIRPSLVTKFIHNKAGVVASKFIRNYLSSFSTDFLFVRGDANLRQGFGGQKGYLYYIDLLFLVLGISGAIGAVIYGKKQGKEDKLNIFMLLFLLTAPIPFSLTRDSSTPHSTRLIIMIIPLMYFLVKGVGILFNKIQKFNQTLVLALSGLVVLVYALQVFDFLHYYHYHYPQISARDWHFGIKEAVVKSKELEGDFSRIYYAKTGESFLPFFHFYTDYFPSNGSCAPVLNSQRLADKNFEGEILENRYYFGVVNWDNLVNSEAEWDKFLFVLPENELIKLNKYISEKDDVELRVLSQEKKIFREQDVISLVSLEKIE